MRFDWLSNEPLEKLVATLSEGFCPQCGGRVTQEHPFPIEPDDLDRERVFARGGCSACDHWLRAGHEGSEPSRDWFAAVMRSNETILTMSLNPPGDDPETDPWDDDWSPDEEED